MRRSRFPSVGGIHSERRNWYDNGLTSFNLVKSLIWLHPGVLLFSSLSNLPLLVIQLNIPRGRVRDCQVNRRPLRSPFFNVAVATSKKVPEKMNYRSAIFLIR
jgi:hypothetical protein